MIRESARRSEDPSPVASYLSYARGLCRARAATLFAWDGREGGLVMRASTRFAGAPEKATRFRLGEGLVGEAAATGRPCYSRNPVRDPRLKTPPAAPRETSRLLALPLKDGERVRAVLNLTWSDDGPPLGRDRAAHLEHTATDLLSRVGPARESLPTTRLLDPARALQARMIPDPGALPGHETRALYRPLHPVGGDLLGVWPGARRHLVAVGDASGHDAGSAMAAAMARALLARAARGAAPLGEIAAELHEVLAAEVPPGWFLTLFLAELIPAEDRLRFLSAGHPPALLDLPGTPAPAPLLGDGAALAMIADPGTTRERPWPAGATLLAYTDGVEAPLRGVAPTAALAARLAAGRRRTADEVHRALEADLTGDSARTDDLTCLLIRRGASRGA